MNNKSISDIFYTIAEYLELKDENPFKIRAYSNAGRTIENLSQDMSKIESVPELRKIQGIGESIAEKILEINKTGGCSYLEELKKDIPPGLLDIMAVPGMGPKKAAQVYKDLGISDVEQLKAFAEEGKLSVLKGFGEKTEANILRGINLRSKLSGRISIGNALPIAKEIINYLKDSLNVKLISEGGSLRRRKEDIGDIDILIGSENKKEALRVMDIFTKAPFTREILAKGDTKSSVINLDGLQVDLRVVDKDCYGAALQYFTGSKQHNIRLRHLAEKEGFKVNEYGVFRLKDGKKVAGKAEEDVYKVFGLPLIPPEIRQTGEEIDIALSGKLPELVERKDIKGDLHIHSTGSDGVNTIPEIAKAASKLGYKYIAVTNHSKSLKIAKGMSIKDLEKQILEIEKFNKADSKIKILAGAETDILKDGSLDYPDSVLKKLDIVIASVHSHFKLPREEMTKRIVKAIKNPYVNIIAHPSCRLWGSRPEIELEWDEIFKSAAEYNTALEINSFPDRLDLRDIYCKRAKEFGCVFSIDTDSHHVNQLEFMEYGVNVARRGWLTAKDIINTKSCSDLINWIKR
ncbi:MAG: DNA polymerase/3'-5' exonuclease PolX [Armatimonadota bacterium]